VASLLTSEDDGTNGNQSQQPPLSRTQSADPTRDETTEATPTETTEETVAEEPTEETPTNEDYVRAIEDYYDLLPEDTDEAWKLLTDRARGKSTGGKKGYERFWRTVESVEVRDSYAAGNRVSATLVYTREDGGTSTEAYSFALVEQDGELMIDNFVRTSGGGGNGGNDGRGNGNNGDDDEDGDG